MKNKKIKVLVFPCGAENAIEIFQALRYSLHVELIGASSVDDHGSFRYENYFGGLPNIRDDSFDREFSALIKINEVDLVFATHDTVVEYLAQRADSIGFHLVNGNRYTAAVTRRKSFTYELFADCTWLPARYPDVKSVRDWPVIVKPDCGQGGQGVTLAHSAEEANRASQLIDSPLFVEYLPGVELTVDCFTDRHRQLVWVGPRTRERVRAGITMRSNSVPLDETIEDIARTINRRLVFRGPWFFQLKQAQGGAWKLLEVASRVAGAMVFQRARGINLPLLTIHDFMNRDVVPLVNHRVNLIDRAIATRAFLDFSFNHVYIDLDDTLIIDEFAVPKVMAFLYQCRAEGKQLHLITRHPADPLITLRNARVSPELFDSIVHLQNQERKANFICDDAIFVDNHFPERCDVARNRSIPVFDVDAIEFFLK